MKRTLLYQIAEKKETMMSYVIITREDNCIVIDGGREKDIPQLKKYTKGRRISAWILTHPHANHIGGFISEIEKDTGNSFDIEKIYYHFPSYEIEDTQLKKEENSVLLNFVNIIPKINDKTIIVAQGDKIIVDECEIEFLFTYHKCLKNNILNNSSLVFKITTPNKSVLFLGDLGSEGGELLFWESRNKLKSDIVQMANHGRMGVGLEVYSEIAPEACLWCCPNDIYNEPEISQNLNNQYELQCQGNIRMYGTATTRRWMDFLNVKKHYVTSEGTYCIEL